MFGIRRILPAAPQRFAWLFAAVLLLAGCAGPNLARDQLETVQPNERPICACSYEIATTINPRINNDENLDKSLGESLDIALRQAKLFTPDAAVRYRIKADILVASEATFSFGDFAGKLSVHYSVLNPAEQEVLQTDISTEAGSDHWYFAGVKRHQRARALNTAKNVMQFVDFLRASNALH
jgi:hypothetical protein